MASLQPVLAAKLAELKLEKLYADIELPLVEVLAAMEQNGIYINREELDKKYPFEPVEDMIKAPVDDDEDVTEPLAEEPEAVADADEDVKIRPDLKRERHDKFDKLQFGDNYDV